MTSVIVATHNRRTLLERTMSALAAQEHPRGGLEIVIVDNASTEAAEAVRLAAALRPGRAADRFARATRLAWFAGYLRRAWGGPVFSPAPQAAAEPAADASSGAACREPR